jgi:hypothetical protein
VSGPGPGEVLGDALRVGLPAADEQETAGDRGQSDASDCEGAPAAFRPPL